MIYLGNSYKNGGRCVAGIEVEPSSRGFNVVKDNNGAPKWIRPVEANSDLGIPESRVGSFKILDILIVDVENDIPTGAHTEDVHFRSISKYGSYTGDLECLCDNNHSLIFGNRGKAVPEEKFALGGYSLMFIKANDLNIETQYDEYGHEKYRIHFTYKSNRYDFPLTDPVYISTLQRKQRSTGNRGDGFYLTLSLGVKYNDWHYKLVAGIIEPF